MKNWLYPFAVILLLSTQACQNSKHYTKLAQKQEAAGLNKEASESYYTALSKKRANIDAQIGMKKTGQTVLNGMLSEFSQKSSFGNKFSNFWFWFETGIKLQDTQSGYRLYPLQLLPKKYFTNKTCKTE